MKIKTDSFKILETIRSEGLTDQKGWALKHLGLENVPYNGKGQRIGFLDTGCDVDHTDLKGQVEAKNFITGNSNTSNPWHDFNGHGTFVTGQAVAKENGTGMVGATPEAKAFHAKVLYGTSMDSRRPSSLVERDLCDAIKACTDEGCGVISMSIGFSLKSDAVEEALEYAVNNGVIPAAAAGNEKLTGRKISYPAAYTNTISVAASNKKDLPQWFSSVGESANKLVLPEISVSSKEYYIGLLPKNKYGKMIGTSQACPLVASVLILWRETREKQGDLPSGKEVISEARKWLHSIANDTNKNGWDPELGHGVLIIDPNETVG